MRRIRKRRLSLLVGLALLGVPLVVAVQHWAVVESRFIRSAVSGQGRSMPYVVYLPEGYTPKKRWPVILFLHGSAERGDNGFTQTLSGLGPALRWHPERFPCLVVMPQTHSPRWSAPSNRLALQALEAVIRRYRGDRRRLYLTGLSMGGYGCWRIAAAYPRRFAAVIPICGGGEPARMAPAVKSLPIWVFHGRADPRVPVLRSREMVRAIRAAGGRRIRYTEYADGGHNVWNRAYSNPAVIAWLLRQKTKCQD